MKPQYSVAGESPRGSDDENTTYCPMVEGGSEKFLLVVGEKKLTC